MFKSATLLTALVLPGTGPQDRRVWSLIDDEELRPQWWVGVGGQEGPVTPTLSHCQRVFLGCVRTYPSLPPTRPLHTELLRGGRVGPMETGVVTGVDSPGVDLV